MFLDKSKSQKEPVSSSSSPIDPIKTSETNHQPITKSQSSVNHLQSQPITNSVSSNGTDPAKSVYRTNGSILSGYVPNPPVRNPLKVTIPSSKPARARSTQSAAEQLGVRSHPPVRVNGGTSTTV